MKHAHVRASIPIGGTTALTTFDEIRSDFAFLDDWEDRYRYVIELGRALPEMPAALKIDANKVRGCASQVWLSSEIRNQKSEVRNRSSVSGLPTSDFRLHFEGDSDAHIVRGLVAILFALVQDKPATEILELDLEGAFASLGLREHLTPQRSNGLASMAQRIRADARTALSAA
jgi:cysteine desulfuration protein SufE